jgi:hypothetical protein
MKINWGTGIVIAFIVFIGFIMFLVISMMTDDAFDYDLVTEEYYKEELAFQEEIDAETNASLLSENIVINRVDEGLLVIFPKNFEFDKIEGTIFVYRPSNKSLDFNISLNKLSSNKILIPENRLIEGRWNISVSWKYETVNYLFRNKTRY